MESDYKICPIKTITDYFMGTKGIYPPESFLMCSVGCAWYDSRAECCAVLALARSTRKK